jgi:hypothetical protein
MRTIRILLLAASLGATSVLAQQPGEARPAAQEKTEQAPTPARSAAEELAALRPVLIGKRYLEQAHKRLAVQLARLGRSLDNPGPWLEDNALVARDYLADVRIMYALEFKEGAQLVSHGMMKSWGMDLERLHQRALANLDRAHGEIAIKQVGKLPWLYVIETGDGYAASRVLLHWRWAELTLKMGEALILGMPTRDVVVFTATLEPEKIEQLRETVDTVERHQGRPVSRKLFQWTPQGWQEFEQDQPLALLPGEGDDCGSLRPQEKDCPALGRSGGGTSEQAVEQGREQRQQQRGAEGEVVGAPAKAEADVARQAADTQQGGQPRQEDAGDEHRDQQGNQPLQHRQ